MTTDAQRAYFERKKLDPEWVAKERERQKLKQRAYQAKHRASLTPEELKAEQDRHNLKRSGMTPEQWQEMFQSQGGVCAICHQPEIKVGYRLSIDHDHACCPGRHPCGKCIRGLLCHNCNRGIGHLQESEEIMTNAIAYLKRPHD